MRRNLLAFLLLGTANLAQAGIYDFTWSNGWQDVLTGYVDTEQDSLFVTNVNPWTPGLNHYLNPLLPDLTNVAFPNNQWKLGAVQEDGTTYDIDDNWDGNLGGTWGFASDLSTEEIQYSNGTSPEDQFFKFYTSIGLTKIYVPSIGQYRYSPDGQSTVNSDGSINSQLSNFAVFDPLVYPPQSLDDFSTAASLISSGGVHRISKRASVPEPGMFALLLTGIFAAFLGRFRLSKKA